MCALERWLRLALLSALACLGCDAAIAAETPAPTPLPEAPEKPWVTTYCSKCHDTAWIGLAGGTETGWATRIRRMVRRGAVIPAERIVPLARYLAAALPPRVTAAGIAASPVNTTVSPVEVRPLQVWIRTAGRGQVENRTVVATVRGEQAGLIRPGQRVRAFQLRSRASMYQGQVTTVDLREGIARIEVALRAPQTDGTEYLLEVIADLGPHLSIPNEAVIEEGERQIVYIKQPSGDFVPRQIRTGRRGELYVEVAEGLKAGEAVVTFGSFFIDAEFRMKGLAGP